MTSIGRFSHDSQTPANPSIPALFLAMSGPHPFTASDFQRLWLSKKISENHPRFEQSIDANQPGFYSRTTKMLHERVTDTFFPSIYRMELAHRIAYWLTAPLPTNEILWEAQVSSGKIGSSGAISRLKSEQLPKDHQVESLIMFRSHHALADGVSLVSAFMELSDEAEKMKQTIKSEIKRRSKIAKSLLQRIILWMKRIIWFFGGSIQAIFYQFQLVWYMPRNPFDLVLRWSGEEEGLLRTVSWCDAAPLEQVQKVARAHNATINDIWVSCVSYAISKQLQHHRKRFHVHDKDLPTFHNINVVIPVHLGGGILPPGMAIGNFIGAFTACLPGESSLRGSDRLLKVHNTLSWLKQSPAPILSYLFARASGYMPSSWTKYLFRQASVNACVSISNVRSSPSKLHIDSHTVESIAGFLPLPPGIPIGVVVTSYAGTLSLTVTAQPWAVPNADQFLVWVLEEYQRLLDESEV
jgi:hypothetical protein